MPVFDSIDEAWMLEALALASEAEAAGEVPVGAVLVRDGEVLGEGRNRVIEDSDPGGHAELVALRDAGQWAANYRLPETTLYVTLEPCCMCAGAIIHARVKRVVYAATDPKTGAAGSQFDVLTSDKHNHQPIVEGGLLANEASAQLKSFFAARRKVH